MIKNRRFKILIIDDSPTMTEMLKDFISDRYPLADVIIFHTGEEILKGHVMPDAIILDYYLDSVQVNALNGLQILKKLNDIYPEVPVIFLTGEENSELARNTIELGAYDYVVKNENAFHRIEILLNNLLFQGELKKDLGSQKFFNRLLIALMVTMIVGLILIKM